MLQFGFRAALVAALTLVIVGTRAADATQKFGPIQLSGNVQSENIVRHPDPGTYEFIMNRNSLRLRLDYDWLQAGKFYGKYDIPFIESSHLFVLYRGVYDSVYDTTPGFKGHDIKGDAYPGPPTPDNPRGLTSYNDYATRVGYPTGDVTAPLVPLIKPRSNSLELSGLSHDERDALKFDNQLREFYVDLKMRGLPLTVRAGRQQVVWGETDNFRMLDRANPLDLTWHFQQEIPAPAFGWDEIRRPLWMFKFLYDLGDVWKLSQSFLEWYWNPGDWFPAKQTFLPRPWGLRFYNPLTNPIDGAFFDGPCLTFSPFNVRGEKVLPADVRGNRRIDQPACFRLLNNTRLFEKGDWSRNPMENSQVGIRYHGIAPGGLEFTLNYFYQRFAGDDGTNYAPLRGINRTFIKRDDEPAVDTKNTQRLVSQGIFPAEAIAPYVHTLGLSANYSDETFTQTVYRLETIYDVGIPFFDVAKPTIIDTPSLPGVTKKNMWKGMIAFDRPTWVRAVNKKSTVFFTGQFFFHYMVNNPDCVLRDRFGRIRAEGAESIASVSNPIKRTYTGLDPQEVARLRRPRPNYPDGLPGDGSCLVGGLDLPSSIRTPGVAPVFRDKIRTWETLATLAAFTFYRGGSIVPIIGVAVDTTNQFNMEPFWTVDYFVTGSVAVNVAQRYFFTPRGHSTPVFETWGLAGLNAGRSETSLRLTYQF